MESMGQEGARVGKVTLAFSVIRYMPMISAIRTVLQVMEPAMKVGLVLHEFIFIV